MSSIEGNYSLFYGENPVDLSWIWGNNSKLSNLFDGNATRNSSPSTSRSSLFNQNSIVEEVRPILPQTSNAFSYIQETKVNRESDSIPLLNNNTDIDQTSNTMRPQTKVVGPRETRMIIPDGPSYVLQAGHHHLVSNKEAYFYLVHPQMPLDITKKVMHTPTVVVAKVVHSSGFSSVVELQKLDLIPGFRCSFLPRYPGKYSAKVFRSPKDANTNFAESLLCPPLEFEVTRNYFLEAKYSNTSCLNLDDNGHKYWGISVDTFKNRLYVADRSNSEVIVVDPTIGKPIHRFGQDPAIQLSGNKLLYRPTGLVVDNVNKRVLICDKDNHRICIFTIDGHFISSFGKQGHGTGEFNYPWDIDISPKGDMMIVSDSRNHRVQFFDRFGNYLKKFSVFETAPFEYKKSFDYPRGVTFSPDGKTVFIADFNINCVVSLVVDTLEYKMIIPNGKMNRPQGITFDESGNLLVCDSRKNLLRILDNDGEMLCSLNKIGTTKINVPVDACCFRGGLVAMLGIDGSIYFV